MQFGQNLDWIRANMAHCIHDANIDAEERQAVKDLWKHTQSVVSKGRYGLVVLDELSLAMKLRPDCDPACGELFAAAPTPGRCDSDRAGYAGGAAKYGRPGNGISAKLFAVENTRRQYTNTPVKVV